MITSQDIRAKSFEKAVFGGYDAASVEQFLENVARTLDDNVREISTLKSKMKILANKVEEYRSTEEAMRLALVSAQQLAAQIEADAKAKAQALIDDATGQSLEILADLKKQTASEEAKLDAAKASYAVFMAEAREMCERQIRFLDQLPETTDGVAMPENEPIESEEEDNAQIDAIIEELAEVPDLLNISEQIIEQPAQDTDDFEATLMFSLD